jgi:hypothetical protein
MNKVKFDGSKFYLYFLLVELGALHALLDVRSYIVQLVVYIRDDIL